MQHRLVGYSIFAFRSSTHSVKPRRSTYGQQPERARLRYRVVMIPRARARV